MNPLAALVASLTGNAATDGSGAGLTGGSETGLFAQLLNANTQSGQSLETLLAGAPKGELTGLTQPNADLSPLTGLPELAGSDLTGLIDASGNGAGPVASDPETAPALLSGELVSGGVLGADPLTGTVLNGEPVATPTADIALVGTDEENAPEGNPETVLLDADAPIQESAGSATPTDLLAPQPETASDESAPAVNAGIQAAGESGPPPVALAPASANPVAGVASGQLASAPATANSPVLPSAPLSPIAPEQGAAPQQPAANARPLGPDGKPQQAADGEGKESGSTDRRERPEQFSRSKNSSAAAQIVKTTVNSVTGQTIVNVSEGSDSEARLNAPLETGINNIQIRAGAPAQGPAATPPAAQAPQVPVNSLAVHIAQQARNGNNRFEIRLDPPELGRVDVRLDVTREGRVTTHLVVERAETLDLLQRDAKGLERALQDAGLDSPKGNLSFSLKDQGQFQKAFRDDNAPAAPTEDNAESEASADDEEIAQRARHYTASGGLDIRI